MSIQFHRLVVTRTLKLSASADKLKEDFLSLSSRDDVARLLDCSTQQLVYWAWIAPKHLRYSAFEITKSSGAKRTIEAPAPVLKVLQRKLLQAMEAAYEPRAPVHGFVKGRGILTNASSHAHRAWVLNIDLAEFFPTIHFGRVRGIFRAKPFNHPEVVATVLAQLVCSDGRLPQGAPTSPIVSNILCSKMDGELRRFAKENGAIYTRYADDITFSVRRRSFPQALAVVTQSDAGSFLVDLSPSLRRLIEDNGFAINEQKVRIQPWKRSQRVTGLVVNQRPNVPRSFIRRTRAMLHAWERHGYDAAQKTFIEKFAARTSGETAPPSLRRRVRGNIAYIGQIRGRDDAVFLRMLTKYQALIGKPLTDVPAAMTTNTQRRDVFICHASSDKKLVVEPLVAELEKAGISVWFDKAEVRWGDSLTGKINEGLETSRYVMVVVSAAFMEKEWPKKELNAALAREIASGKTTVLPLMVGSASEVSEFQSKLPLQADKLHLHWSAGVETIVAALEALLAQSTRGA